MGAVMIIRNADTDDTMKVTPRAFQIVWEKRGYRELTATATKADVADAAEQVGVHIDTTAKRADIHSKITDNPSQED